MLQEGQRGEAGFYEGQGRKSGGSMGSGQVGSDVVRRVGAGRECCRRVGGREGRILTPIGRNKGRLGLGGRVLQNIMSVLIAEEFCFVVENNGNSGVGLVNGAYKKNC